MKHTGIYKKTRQFSLQLNTKIKIMAPLLSFALRIYWETTYYVVCMLKKGIQMQIHTKASKQHFAFEVIYNICGVF